MSSAARKSGDRNVIHRGREHPTLKVARREVSALNSIRWDEDVRTDPNAVFVPVLDADAFIDKMDRCIEQANLSKLEHQFLDGGVLIRFRRKHDADVFRMAIAE